VRLALSWLLIFCLATPAFGRLDCPTALAEVGATHSVAHASFLRTLESTLDHSQIDPAQKELILKKATEVRVQERDVDPDKIRFKKNLNPLGLLGFSRKKVLVWPTEKSLEQTDPELLSMKMIDLTGELMFEAPQNPSVFLQSPTSFFRNNVNAIATKLYLQYFTMTEGAPVQLKSESISYKILKTVLKTMLPYEVSEVRNAKLDATTAQLFETGGPQAVYSYVRKVYGPSIALRYWLRHVKSAGQALFLGFCLYMAPTVKDTWILMQQESSVQLTNVDKKFATEVLQDFKKSDVDLIQTLKTQANDQQEAKALADFEKAYGEENAPKK
jgi:hypothetical protein